MEFLSLLIVLGLVQWWGSGGPMQHDRWFDSILNLACSVARSAGLRLLFAIVLPVVALLLLQIAVVGYVFGLPSLLLYVAVLLFSLGRGNFSENLQAYLVVWRSGNFESAYEKAVAIGDFKPSDTIADHTSLHAHVRLAMIHEAYQRWFAVVFWFVVLGPVGALLYRLVYLCGRSETLDAADRLLALRATHYLDWLPARLLAFSFCLTGNFVDSFSRYGLLLLNDQPIPELLESCATAALGAENDSSDQEQFIETARAQLLALQALLGRSLICWLVVLAVMEIV